MPTLEIIYRDVINDTEHTARVRRVDGDNVIEVSHEDLRIYLQNLSDTARYTMVDDDLTVLRAIAADLGNGVSGLTFRRHRITT